MTYKIIVKFSQHKCQIIGKQIYALQYKLKNIKSLFILHIIMENCYKINRKAESKIIQIYKDKA